MYLDHVDGFGKFLKFFCRKTFLLFLLRGSGRDRIYDQIPLKIWYKVI